MWHSSCFSKSDLARVEQRREKENIDDKYGPIISALLWNGMM